MAITKEQVIDALKYVDDPDLKKDIVTLGMVKDVEVNGKEVSFTVVLTTPACPMKDMIQKACENAILHFVEKEAIVKVNMTAQVQGKKQESSTALSGVKNIIAVASGKGGVGKSTVTANLAMALIQQGAKVGIVDADVYGPSMPIMFDAVHERPLVQEIEGQNKIMPIDCYGVKLLSIGFFADINQAVAWRGPIATRALQQLFNDAYWGELDYLLVDLPPGTGDIHLTLATSIPITGAVIVTTPQQVAIADARKGMAFFRNNNINIPVLGIVENMSWFTPTELPENKYFIFGQGGAEQLAEEFGTEVLGKLPLVQSIREAADAGRPAVLQQTTPQAIAFTELAQKVAQKIAIQHASQIHTEEVKN